MDLIKINHNMNINLRVEIVLNYDLLCLKYLYMIESNITEYILKIKKVGLN